MSMDFEKYLKVGQNVFFSHRHHDEVEVDAFSAELAEVRAEGLIFNLPYPKAKGSKALYPKGTVFELNSSVFGLGLRLTGELAAISGDGRILVKPNVDLELFSERKYLRAEVGLRVACVRRPGGLQKAKRMWTALRDAVQKGENIGGPFSFHETSIWLGAGGLGLPLKVPVEDSELCLFLLELTPGTPSVPALAEVAWKGKPQDGRLKVGMKFIDITQDDRVRIDNHVRAVYTNQGLDLEFPPYRPPKKKDPAE